MSPSCSSYTASEAEMANRLDTSSNPSINGTFLNPFTCIVAGPSGSGKTTFVCNLISSHSLLVSPPFSFVKVYIGTPLEENALFKHLASSMNSIAKDLVDVVDVRGVYDNDLKLMEKHFAHDLKSSIDEFCENGCVVFDDLMQELARANLLVDLFTKISSHKKLSVIYLTQDLFFRGKNPQENHTLFINAHHLVLFKQPMDTSSFRLVASRLGSGIDYKKTYSLLRDVAEKYRYVIISGTLKRDKSIQFTSDIFHSHPITFQRVFSLI